MLLKCKTFFEFWSLFHCGGNRNSYMNLYKATIIILLDSGCKQKEVQLPVQNQQTKKP